MKLLNVTVIACGAALLLTAAETRITRTELPAAVEKTVQEQSKGATIRGFTKEVENGRTVYEAEMTVNGRGRDISMTSDGNIVETENRIALDQVPAAARRAIQRDAGKGRITKVESVNTGNTVHYEATVSRSGRHREIAVDADGKPVHEE
ncbi:MAG TPA: hypothetical protein VFA04_26200 [Bryobacteraceae bacterium]|nr:hypothetical protein [Bryobacteraceae bacterium]